MSLFEVDRLAMQGALRRALSAHWRLFVIQGVTMIVLGLAAVGAPVVAGVAIDLYLGALLMIGGVVGLVAVFSQHNAPAFLWGLVTSALLAAAGVLLLSRPPTGVASLTLVLTAFFIAEGVFQAATSLAYRHFAPAAWGWMLASGLADLVMAGLIIAGLPASLAWALGLIVGVNLLSSGWALTMAGFAGRDAAAAARDDESQ